ncbi:MAG TPA: hypothetical protein VF796_12765 [Humisphaera sp.]
MPRRSARTLSLLVAAIAACSAARPAAAAGGTDPAGPATRPTAIELDLEPVGVPPPSPAVLAKLSSKAADAELRDAPLIDVLAAFQQQQGVTIFVDWKALEASGILRDVRLFSKLSLKGLTLAEALRLVLEDVSTPTAKVGYAVRGNTIRVAVTDFADPSTLSVRVYDVADLLVSERARRRAINGLPPGGPETRPAANEIFCGAAPDAQQIIELLMKVTTPRSWRDDGGTAWAREFNGRLVVGHSADNHKRIEALLAALRATAAVPQPPAR